MSVWQPQYTLMFTALLAEPGPHYYLHVLLPGGAESLGVEGYELEPGSKSSLMGTLCRVSFAQRNPDSTLTLVVQGLARGLVLAPTQYTPYSRGDVQLLPDSEALLAAALATERFLRRGLSEVAAGGASSTGDDAGGATTTATAATTISDAGRRRLVAAAASAELRAFLPYEAASLSVDADDSLAPLNQLNASAAIDGVQAQVGEVLRTAPMPAGEEAQEEQVKGDGPDELYGGSAAIELLDAAIVAAKGATAATGVTTLDGEKAAVASMDDVVEKGMEETGEVLRLLELQVWLELDHMLQAIRAIVAEPDGLPSRSTKLPVPTQLLALLPPPPEGGWPEDFQLARICRRLEDASAQRGGAVGEVRGQRYVPLEPNYPARRRAERLSWMLHSVIGNQKVGVNAFGGSPYQALIEADGTAERLRMCLLRLREIVGQVRGS